MKITHDILAFSLAALWNEVQTIKLRNAQIGVRIGADGFVGLSVSGRDDAGKLRSFEWASSYSEITETPTTTWASILRDVTDAAERVASAERWDLKGPEVAR